MSINQRRPLSKAQLIILLVCSGFFGALSVIQSAAHLGITRVLFAHAVMAAIFYFVVMYALCWFTNPFIERRRARKRAALPPLDLTLPDR